MKMYRVGAISKVRSKSQRKTISSLGSNFSYSLVPRELNDSTKVLKSSLVLPELNKTTGAKITLPD